MISFMSCRSIHIHDYYAGFVVDQLGNPVDSVMVKEDWGERSNITYSDKKGYFRMNRLENCLPDLIFSKEGYQSDTVRMAWIQHGEVAMYSPLPTSASSIVTIKTLNIE